MGGANANSTYFYTYFDAKYVKKCTSWRTLKMNNPLGLWSWDPLASSYDYGGQNLIHSAYEARKVYSVFSTVFCLSCCLLLV